VVIPNRVEKSRLKIQAARRPKKITANSKFFQEVLLKKIIGLREYAKE